MILIFFKLNAFTFRKELLKVEMTFVSHSHGLSVETTLTARVTLLVL